VTLGHLPAVLALAAATGAWLAVALLGFVVLWWRP